MRAVLGRLHRLDRPPRVLRPRRGRGRRRGLPPLLPPRLAYPELFPPDQGHAPSFYDGTPAGLADTLAAAAARLARDDLWQGDPDCARQAVERFTWPVLAPQLDDALAAVTGEETA
jgi:glycosyltransferase involved in cell wall biosynthesis